MKVQVPDYLAGVVDSTREAFCDMLYNPALWSEAIIKKTLERDAESLAFDPGDVQVIIRDYLTVLADAIRKGELF